MKTITIDELKALPPETKVGLACDDKDFDIDTLWSMIRSAENGYLVPIDELEIDVYCELWDGPKRFIRKE